MTSSEFVLLLSPKDKDTLGAVRCMSGLQAAEADGHIYLKGKNNGDIAIRQLPALHSYFLDEKELLFPANGLTPIGKLPQINWQSLPDFLPVEMPIAAMPGNLPAKEKICLVETGEMQEGFALLTHLQQWKTWAETASEMRLKQLQFAVSANNEVLIIGAPLPHLPGKEFWIQNNVLIPAGYQFEIKTMPGIIATELNNDEDSFLLFDKDANWQAIPLNAFVQATRSAVRLTEFVK